MTFYLQQELHLMDIVGNIQVDSVLITQDFSMKFLPVHYRETQAEFFEKRDLMALDSFSEQTGSGAGRANVCAHN